MNGLRAPGLAAIDDVIAYMRGVGQAARLAAGSRCLAAGGLGNRLLKAVPTR